jgi:hypothetical protein
MTSCDNVAGLPVIPRFALSGNCRNDILIAALLRQPIVARAHHQEVAAGYGLLDETASFVNSLGAVAWRDMNSISRSLYARKTDGRRECVRMFSKRVCLPVPEGTNQVQVERPWLDDSAEEVVFWRPADDDRVWRMAGHPETIAVKGGQSIEIASGPAAAGLTGVHLPGPLRLMPVARRLLTEGRDRALPSLHRFARIGRA